MNHFINEDYLKLFNKYNAGLLSIQENFAFKERLKADPDFKSQYFEFIRILNQNNHSESKLNLNIKTMKDKEFQEIQKDEELSKLIDAILEEEKDPDSWMQKKLDELSAKKPNPIYYDKTRKWLRRGLSIAAGICLLIIGANIFLDENSEKDQQKYYVNNSLNITDAFNLTLKNMPENGNTGAGFKKSNQLIPRLSKKDFLELINDPEKTVEEQLKIIHNQDELIFDIGFSLHFMANFPNKKEVIQLLGDSIYSKLEKDYSFSLNDSNICEKIRYVVPDKNVLLWITLNEINKNEFPKCLLKIAMEISVKDEHNHEFRRIIENLKSSYPNKFR